MFDASAQFLYNFQFDSKSLFDRPVTVRSVKRRDRGKSLDRLVFVLQTVLNLMLSLRRPDSMSHVNVRLNSFSEILSEGFLLFQQNLVIILFFFATSGYLPNFRHNLTIIELI